MSGHVEHSPSGLYRVFACPASVRLTRGVMETTVSPHALLGTVVHHIIEISWREQTPAADLIGLEFEGITVTKEMAADAQIALDEYARDAEDEDLVFCETPVDLAPIGLAAHVRGTLDFARYRPSTRKLWVKDYKNGTGWVDAEGNHQLRAYALGMVCKLAERGLTVSEVEIAIIQPNGVRRG